GGGEIFNVPPNASPDPIKVDSRLIVLTINRRNTRPDLSDVTDLLSLPTDRPQPPVPTPNVLFVSEAEKLLAEETDSGDGFIFRTKADDLDIQQTFTFSVQPGDTSFCSANQATNAVASANTMLFPTVMSIATPV